jgi:hypothetical protein
MANLSWDRFSVVNGRSENSLLWIMDMIFPNDECPHPHGSRAGKFRHRQAHGPQPDPKGGGKGPDCASGARSPRGTTTSFASLLIAGRQFPAAATTLRLGPTALPPPRPPGPSRKSPSQVVLRHAVDHPDDLRERCLRSRAWPARECLRRAARTGPPEPLVSPLGGAAKAKTPRIFQRPRLHDLAEAVFPIGHHVKVRSGKELIQHIFDISE